MKITQYLALAALLYGVTVTGVNGETASQSETTPSPPVEQTTPPPSPLANCNGRRVIRNTGDHWRWNVHGRARLSNKGICYIAPNAFSGAFPWQFKLDRNILTEVGLEFQGLRSTQYIDLQRNQIRTVASKAFSGCTSLKQLILSNNKLTSLGQIYSNLPKLFNVEAQSNLVSEIPNDAFVGSPKIQYLWLYDNRLTSIDMEFSNLSWLHLVNVHTNQISSINPRAFEGINSPRWDSYRIGKPPKEMSFYFHNNPELRCIPDGLFAAAALGNATVALYIYETKVSTIGSKIFGNQVDKIIERLKLPNKEDSGTTKGTCVCFSMDPSSKISCGDWHTECCKTYDADADSCLQSIAEMKKKTITGGMKKDDMADKIQSF